jgi:3-oxoacyl-[acyl-carrier-protein] synthase-1
LDAIEHTRSGLRHDTFEGAALDTWLGRVGGLEHTPLPSGFERYDCRNNRLALVALAQDGFEDAVRRALRRYGAQRIAVILGTSTSGIRETELSYQRRNGGALPASADSHRHRHNLFSLPAFVREYLGLSGPALAISTACSSSAKAFASASTLCASPRCSDSSRWSCWRHVPAVRGRPTATVYPLARRAVSR